MARARKNLRKMQKTLVGRIAPEILDFTVGKDMELDLALAEADCVGSAAHAVMLAGLRLKKPLFSRKQLRQVISALRDIRGLARDGRIRITGADQDIHLAVERMLTEKLGQLGKRIHTARSRNDQVAVDLRLYAKTELLDLMESTARLAQACLKLAGRHIGTPMVGRTHLQPAMPSSVGLWASAHAESLLDDLIAIVAAYDVNDRCPLGSAAGYGVPVKIDRKLTARLLGFKEPVHNVLYASNSRGKMEFAILSACSQVMLTLSRLAEDLILYSMPEFGYFSLPAEYCTGSSIMPQKRNPDVMELVRAKASKVLACAASVGGMVKGLAGGYNRDLQETKDPFMEGLKTTKACVRVTSLVVRGLQVNRRALGDAFRPEVFATDKALDLVMQGMSFRDAYDRVKANIAEIELESPVKAILKKKHLGATAGLDLNLLFARAAFFERFAGSERKRFEKTVSRLLRGA